MKGERKERLLEASSGEIGELPRPVGAVEAAVRGREGLAVLEREEPRELGRDQRRVGLVRIEVEVEVGSLIVPPMAMASA